MLLVAVYPSDPLLMPKLLSETMGYHPSGFAAVEKFQVILTTSVYPWDQPVDAPKPIKTGDNTAKIFHMRFVAAILSFIFR
jgi:hypothetical protein